MFRTVHILCLAASLLTCSLRCMVECSAPAIPTATACSCCHTSGQPSDDTPDGEHDGGEQEGGNCICEGAVLFQNGLRLESPESIGRPPALDEARFAAPLRLPLTTLVQQSCALRPPSGRQACIVFASLLI